MKTTMITFLFTTLLSSQAFAFGGVRFNPSIQTQSTSEAGYGCTDGRCLAQAPKSNILNFCEEMKSRAAWGKDLECTNVGIFNDGNDRALINDLRRKKNLTDEEKALLVAANKMGSIGICDGKIGGNAFVVRYNGRPAVVTSAHMLMDKQGNLNCPLNDLSKVFYMPNTGLYDPKNPKKNKEIVMKRVGIQFPPANWAEIKNGYGNTENDFAIFYLDQDITKDKMLDGTNRGYFKFAETMPSNENIYMIGLAKDVDKGMNLTYQKNCDGFMEAGRFYHTCDTLMGSSASVLSTYEKGEFKFRGLHTTGTEDKNLSESDKRIVPNVGTLSDNLVNPPLVDSSAASFKLSN